jgi:putative SOS response-associated peptidase YedK
MCGRILEISKPKALSDEFKIPIAKIPPVKPSYNVAPTQPVLSILIENSVKKMDYLVWGLIPSWAKDPAIGNRMINARAETVHEKPAYRGPFKNSRCLVLADGFYEWRKTGTKKQPYCIRLKSGQPFAFAGLWSHWSSPDGSEIRSCTIMTTEANPFMKPIHDRMPVILGKKFYDEWLDTTSCDVKKLKAMLVPHDEDDLEAHPVSTFVNSPSNNSAECIAEIASQ